MTVEYRVGDAFDILRDEPAESARLVHLDDAWARPKRGDAFGVTYPTHAFTEEDDHFEDLESDHTVRAMIDACWRCLEPGGRLLVDVDDWLHPRVMEYATRELDVTGVATLHTTLVSADGTPDRSTPGMYLSTGGYSTVLVRKAASVLPGEHPARADPLPHVVASRQREQYGWGTVKPLAVARTWLQAFADAGDRVLVPCAGTAPMAIAAEMEHGSDANALAVDIEAEAKACYERRRADELDRQVTLGGGWG